MAAVLVVEDHADTAETLAVLLATWGHRVQICRTGKEALECSFQPDIVLLDIGLPYVDGYHVAQHLRRPGLKLIAFTGYGRPEDIRRCQQVGFDLHLLKPVHPDRLREVLSQFDPVSR